MPLPCLTQGFSQLDMQMSTLSMAPGGPNAPSTDQDGTADAANFMGIVLQTLWHIDSFRVALSRITQSTDPLVVGMQTLMLSLCETNNKALSPQLLRAALPSFFTDPTRQRIALASEPSEAYEAMISAMHATADTRFVSCIEQFFSISLTEMCECVCDEMLEPMQHKHACTYVSIAQLLRAQPNSPGSFVDLIGSGSGPICPQANCSAVMKIQRYLMSPTPVLISIGLVWDDVDIAQPNANQVLLRQITPHLDMQRAFRGVREPSSAALKAVLCASDDRLLSFVNDAQGSWCVLYAWLPCMHCPLRAIILALVAGDDRRCVVVPGVALTKCNIRSLVMIGALLLISALFGGH